MSVKVRLAPVFTITIIVRARVTQSKMEFKTNITPSFRNEYAQL